jgi:hypothetical protein
MDGIHAEAVGDAPVIAFHPDRADVQPALEVAGQRAESVKRSVVFLRLKLGHQSRFFQLHELGVLGGLDVLRAHSRRGANKIAGGRDIHSDITPRAELDKGCLEVGSSRTGRHTWPRYERSTLWQKALHSSAA